MRTGNSISQRPKYTNWWDSSYYWASWVIGPRSGLPLFFTWTLRECKRIMKLENHLVSETCIKIPIIWIDRKYWKRGNKGSCLGFLFSVRYSYWSLIKFDFTHCKTHIWRQHSHIWSFFGLFHSLEFKSETSG